MLQGHRREGVAGHVELQGLVQPRILGPPLEDDIGPLVPEPVLWAVCAPREHRVGLLVRHLGLGFEDAQGLVWHGDGEREVGLLDLHLQGVVGVAVLVGDALHLRPLEAAQVAPPQP